MLDEKEKKKLAEIEKIEMKYLNKYYHQHHYYKFYF